MHKKRDSYLEKIDELLADADIEAVRRDLENLAPDGKLLLDEDLNTGFGLICNVISGSLTLERHQEAKPQEVWGLSYPLAVV